MILATKDNQWVSTRPDTSKISCMRPDCTPKNTPQSSTKKETTKEKVSEGVDN